MIEIINIIYLFFAIFCIFSFPLNSVFINKNLKKYNYNIFEIYSLNIILILSIFLFLSFFKFNILFVYYFFLGLSFLNLFFFDWKKFNNKILILTTFLIILTSYTLSISSYPYLEWDASVNWIFKVINFKNNFSFENLKNVPGVKEYPHIGTYLWAMFWKASFFDYEHTGRIVLLFIYLTSFLTLISNVKLDDVKKILLFIFIIAIAFDNILFSGYQEPLMFFLCIVFVILTKKICSNQKLFLNYFFLILCSNLIIWTKNEGMFILIFLSFFILLKKEILYKHKIILLLTFIILILIKKNIFLYYFGNFFVGWEGYEIIKFSEFFSYEILQRFPYLLFQVFITFFKYPIYILFILLLIIFSSKEKNLKNNYDYIFFFLINIAMAIAIFYFTNDHKWKFHSQVGLDRMLYQTSGVYLIFARDFLQKIISNNKVKKLT